MIYEINEIDALGRNGFFEINNVEIKTPNLIPVVHPFDNLIKPKEIKEIGFKMLFTNSYIIYQQESLRIKILKKGLHNYLNFDGLIATDSGAFQMYMYQNSKINIEPEIIESFQEKIGSDFPVILDLPVQLDDNYEIAKKKVLKTIERAKDNIKRREEKNCHWIGPIHGGKYNDLLKISAAEMSRLDFDIYALGGLVKGFLDYRFKETIEMLIQVKKNIISNKPLHMFGLGLPQFFSLAVACGCDLMDSAAYILYAQENRYFDLSTGTKQLSELREFPCNCPTCSKFSPKEVKSLPQEKRTELLARHNLYISYSELKTIRQAISEGNLWELVEQRVKNHPRLVDALSHIKCYLKFFENFEKRYKDHGRLFSSLESLNRPLIYRYKHFAKKIRRKPSKAKYLIILPELDVRSQNSPSLSEWISIIESSSSLIRKYINIAFFSDVFGVIPFELQNTYPLGQYESRNYSNMLKIHKNKVNVSDFDSENLYSLICILNPVNFINEYKELVGFNKRDNFNRYILSQKKICNTPIKTFSKIGNLIKYINKIEENDH